MQFKQMAERVPAYKDFLRKNGVAPSSVVSWADFVRLPIIDKENYLSQYSLTDLSWDGVLASGATIAESSGTTGASFLWPRTYEQEFDAAALQMVLFEEIFETLNKSSLFVVCFHLGPHIAGLITVDAIKRMLDSGMPGGLVTPGLEKNDTVRLVKKLSPLYDQTVLIGYPPFIKDVITEGAKQGIVWKDLSVKFLFSGESFPESWRENLLRLSGQFGVGSSLNLFGSADLGLMGFETPLTIRVRQEAGRDQALAEKLGSTIEFVPPLYQFCPSSRYFESVGGELICSGATGIPLIRYNLKDRGQVFLPSDFSGHEGPEPYWQLPAVTVLGRSNYTATLYALNIYPEHVQEILAKEPLTKHLSGKFFLKTVYNTEHDQHLEVHAELALDAIPSPELERLTADALMRCLQEINLEYKKLHHAIGDRARPVVRLYPPGSDAFRAMKMKHKYIVKE